jgi:signal transduction histidine kinase
MMTIEDFSSARLRPAGAGGTGYGLTGMKERAELAGGMLTAGPTGRGFLVRLWIPA